MGIAELFFIAVGLSMDAFAVAVGKGLGMRRLDMRHAVVIALFFGGFQALMPVIGWLLGSAFAQYVEAVDHWIAFVLLVLIGANMIREAFHEEDEEGGDAEGAQGPAGAAESNRARLDIRELLLMAVATSIDALAVGVTLSFLHVNIVFAALFIGVITFALSLGGVVAGNRVGSRWRKPSSIAGGVILIVIGAKILLESLIG